MLALGGRQKDPAVFFSFMNLRHAAHWAAINTYHRYEHSIETYAAPWAAEIDSNQHLNVITTQ